MSPTLTSFADPAGGATSLGAIQAAEGSPYGETRWKGPELVPDIDNPTGQARPSGSGPRGRVVDAEYRKNR